MEAFLSQVAAHFYKGEDISNLCFIFPNRRSLVFFKKYLCENVAKSRSTILEPALYTMNDFFYKIAGVHPCDQVHQLLELYTCYSELYPNPESLDEFIFWGGILISDFNDVDKYLIDAQSLFTNVKDFRSIQDSFDYISEEQKKAIEKFVSNFKTGGKYKDEFLKLWNILYPLYQNFNDKLKKEGYSYEGQVYRALAQRLKTESIIDVLTEDLRTKRFIFVGLNALNECEKTLLRKLRNAKMAEFCWDYSSEWIKDKANKSSFFLDKNLEEFPQAEGFKLDIQGLTPPEINVLSIPSSVGQAKQLPHILDDLGAKGIETAIVIPDENLLLPVLNSIPENIVNINVTMGYPMRSSALWTLMNDIATLQLHLRLKGDVWHFYHKQLRTIFSNSIIKSIISEEEKAVIETIINEAQYYVSEQILATPLFKVLFVPVVKDHKSLDLVNEIIEYQRNIILEIGRRLCKNEDMGIELDFAREYYLGLGSMQTYNLKVLPATYFRLLSSLIGGASVPFKGEPLNGLQIMGPLETRSLDFENLVVLSCNEDVFPSRNSSSSFIPPELRKGFGLPTYEFQDAVWAYYFYRMIQRSKRVWLLYDSRTEGLHSGEESRYIKQLSMHFGANIKRFVAKADIHQTEQKATNSIAKTAEMIAPFKSRNKATRKNLSASSLQQYLKCKAQFYYAQVLGLEAVKEVMETLDGSMIGKAYHSTMEHLYPKGIITVDRLQSYLKGDIIESEVEKNILENLDTMEIVGKNLIYKNTIIRYVRQTIKRDIELLESKNLSEFNMIEGEKFVDMVINDFNFVGYIDRFDSIDKDIIRIVDYKTGKGDMDFDIGIIQDIDIAERVFEGSGDKAEKIALQLYLYVKMAKHSYPNSEFELSIYHTLKLFKEKIKNMEIPSQFIEEMDAKLVKTLQEIENPDIPFDRTEDEGNCAWCNFKIICGR